MNRLPPGPSRPYRPFKEEVLIPFGLLLALAIAMYVGWHC